MNKIGWPHAIIAGALVIIFLVALGYGLGTIKLPGGGEIPLTPPSRSTPFPDASIVQPDAFIIEPYCSMFGESPVYVQEHRPIVLTWRWNATSPELVQDHIDAADYGIYLDGQRIFAEHRTEIEYVSEKNLFRVSWYADVGALSQGRHRAERHLSWSRKISDGWRTFGPGGEKETEWDYCDIIVK